MGRGRDLFTLTSIASHRRARRRVRSLRGFPRWLVPVLGAHKGICSNQLGSGYAPAGFWPQFLGVFRQTWDPSSRRSSLFCQSKPHRHQKQREPGPRMARQMVMTTRSLKHQNPVLSN